MTSRASAWTFGAFSALAVGACIAAAGCTVSSPDSTGGMAVDGAAEAPSVDLGSSASEPSTVSGSAPEESAPQTTVRQAPPVPDRATRPASSTSVPGTTVPITVPLTGWDATDAYLERRLLDNGDSAASFAISIDGEIVHTAAFGIRSLIESDPVEPEDRFRIASISKTIAAITMLQLVEDGVVGLDDPVGGLIAPTLGVDAVAGGTADITVRELLSHRSGFGQFESLFFGGQVASCRDAATVGFTRSLQSAPGTTFRYSNMNYCVIGLLIEQLTGLPYEQAAYQQLLTPLGLSGMRLAPTYDPGPGEVDHRTVVGRNYMEALGAAGAWVATPSDLVTIIDSLDMTKSGWKPLDEATLDVMQTNAQDPLIPDVGYGLGLILYGGGAYGHTGTIESTHAMVLDRNDGVSWAVTVSGEYPSATGALAGIVDDALVAGGFVAAAPLEMD